MTDASIHAHLKEMIDANDVILFMKGTAQFPQCGFSATAAKILQHLGVPFKDVNVLEDQVIREGIKSYSNWPTIPQLYIKGEFIGGCDIMREMFEAGELHDLICAKGIAHVHHHG